MIGISPCIRTYTNNNCELIDRNFELVSGNWFYCLPDAKQRFANKSSTPLYGYNSEPRKIKCSNVCGSPSSSCASVAATQIKKRIEELFFYINGKKK